MSTYAPDPACAAELEQATTPDAKQAILEKHGWTCDKKGDRWTYRKGDGRVIKSLTTLVKELSNDDPFASGSDDDDAKDVNAPIDSFFGTLGPHVDLDAASLEEARKLLIRLPVKVASLVGEETAVALRRAPGVPCAPVVLDVLRTNVRQYDDIRQQTIPDDLQNTINKFNEAKKVVLFDEVLPKVSLDLLNLPAPKAIDALQQFQAAFSNVRTPSPWLKKKIIELMPIASTPAPAPLSGVDNAKNMLVQVMGGIGRQDVLDANLEKQLGLLTDDAALAYAQYVRGQDPRVLWGLGPGLQAWLLEGISNGAKREVKASSPKKKKKSRRRSRSRSRSRSSSRSRSRSRSRSCSRSRSRDDGIKPVYDDPRVAKRARQILRKCKDNGTLGQWELDGHTVAALCALKKEHQIEICEHLRSFPRDKIKNLNGWMMGGIRRCISQNERRRSRSRGRRRRSRSRSRSPEKPKPGGAKANEAFFARLEGHVSVGDGGIDQKTFQTLAVAVEKMDAKLAEKCGKSCARRLKRGSIPAYGNWLVECAGRALKDRDAKPMGALLKRLDDLRFDFDLNEDAFASGTLRDLGWLLPRNAALCVVDALRSSLDRRPSRDADEALDDAISDRLQDKGGADERSPPALPPRRVKPVDSLGVQLPDVVQKAFIPLQRDFGVAPRDIGRPNLVQLRDSLTEAEAAQVLELLHVALSKKRNAPHSIQAWVRESIQKHIAKRSLIKGGSSPRAPSSAEARPFGRSPRDKPSGEMRLPDSVADEWARIDRKYRCGPCPRKIVGDLAKLLKEEEAVQCVKNFGAELKKNGSIDPVKFIFNDSRRIYYARTDRSSSRSPGAPRRKKAKTAPAPAPAPEDTAKLEELLDG